MQTNDVSTSTTAEWSIQQRIELDLKWTVTAGALVVADYWQQQGVQAAACAGWRVPPVDELFPFNDPNPWWLAKLRLGHYFEQVHASLLRAQPGVVIHALNYPLQTAGQTLGELDCLYRTAAGDAVHREVAVKYFLARKDSGDACDWVGTSKVDRLDLKLRKLANHQAQLSILAHRQNAWPSSLPLPDRREVLLLGAFFRHPSFIAWPDVVGPHAERGFWCDSDEFAEQGQRQTWKCLHKPWWLSLEHRAQAPAFSAPEIATIVAQAHRALLVVSATTDDHPTLSGRGFVVPRGWASSTDSGG